jgi:serine/threonine protein kinase
LFPGTCPEALSLLEGLLRFDPNRRLNVEEALNHEFLQDFRDESIEEVCPHPLQASVEAVNEASPNLINSVVDEISYYVKKSPTSSIQQHNHESDDDNWDYAVKKIRSDSM